VTHLRKMMLEELQRRNYSQTTVRAYLLAVRQFAEYFHQPPDQLGPDHIRRFQSYLLQEKKLNPRSVAQRVAALRFLFVKTLKRHYMLEHIPFPKVARRLPIVLSEEEVGRLIDSATMPRPGLCREDQDESAQGPRNTGLLARQRFNMRHNPEARD
jgi:integrase/recombinase XerD